ncbi:MAG: hypothetical protein ACXVWV_04520 [Nocardioides sp.]
MTRTRRTLAALLVTAAAGITGVAGVTTGTAAQAQAPTAPAMTRLTFSVHGCEGCEIQPVQYIAGQRHAWQGKKKVVKDGTVTFTFASQHTHGLSVWIRGPWEGQDGTGTGYVANVAWRYDHEQVGSTVTRDDVRSKTRASGCWAGTDAARVTIPLEVRKVMVQGYTHRTAGTLAWTKVTQDWWRPMLRTDKGILGTQDVMPCQQP